MIYTTKRFSVGDAATGFGIGVSAGAILGDKIEGGIKKISHNLKYDNNKFLAQLEKEKEEMKSHIKDLENLKRKDPKAYWDAYTWGDAHDDLKYMKELVGSIEKDIKKVKTNPEYGKELSRRMNVSTSGLGMALGGTIGGIGGGLLARKMTKKFSKIGEFIDTVKKAREYPKGTLTKKELKDLGFKTYPFKTYPGMKTRDELILESREARKELEKLGKKAAKGVAIGGAVAGGLYLGKKIHDKQKEKKFSTAGREWAGFKGGTTVCSPSETKSFSSKTKEEDFREELNDAYKKNNRKRNISHAVLGGSLGMVAGALKKGGNPKSMLIGTAIGSSLGSLSEYGYRKATKQDKKYQKEVDKRVSDYHEKLKDIPNQPNWNDYKDNKKYINAIKNREKKIIEAGEVRNKALNDIKRNTSKNPGKYNILRKE